MKRVNCKRSAGSRSRRVILPLSPGEATAGVLGPAVGSPVQEGHGQTRKCAKCHEDDGGIGASLL